MYKHRVIAIDLETAVPWDHVIEIGCVEVEWGEIGRSYHAFVRPPVAINWRCQKVHGLANWEMVNCPDFAEVVHGLAEFIGTSPLLAHYASVEKKILRKEMDRLHMHGWQAEDFLCTLKLARQSGAFGCNKLRSICDYLDIQIMEQRPGYHDALSDARMCAEVYIRMLSDGYIRDS